jgi:hypothetical protein
MSHAEMKLNETDVELRKIKGKKYAQELTKTDLEQFLRMKNIEM